MPFTPEQTGLLALAIAAAIALVVTVAAIVHVARRSRRPESYNLSRMLSEKKPIPEYPAAAQPAAGTQPAAANRGGLV